MYIIKFKLKRKRKSLENVKNIKSRKNFGERKRTGQVEKALIDKMLVIINKAILYKVELYFFLKKELSKIDD